MFPIVLVSIVVAISQLAAAEINCERIDQLNTYKKCCFLNATTEIIETGATLAGLENSDVDAILFEFNRKIQFLPVNVYKIFPKLEFYLARNASVKEITALNFRQLTSLKVLELRFNQIEFIPNDCFEGLEQLIELGLRDNKIKTVNGVAFANLPRLFAVDLRGNICIDTVIGTVRDPKESRRRISRNCGSVDDAKKEIKCISLIECKQTYDKQFAEMFNRTPGCCELEHGTYIDYFDYFFAADANYTNLEIIFIIHQPNIEFLPVSVHERFPRLKIYHVQNTPVQKITKKNFEKMYELVVLFLRGNQFESIKSDTFEDLINLKTISLRNQRLTALNGQAFANLLGLENIILTQNYCIDENFSGENVKKATAELISNSCGFEEIDSEEIFCEKFLQFGLHDSCFVTERTAINSTNFVIGEQKDEEIGGMIFDSNKNIEYLPNKIYLQFPNLVVYKADRCSLTQISKQNFEQLKRLKVISLVSNQLKKISGNTFTGLGSLQEVNLSANKIKSINGRTFDHIPLLTIVDLRSNECIDDKLEKGQSVKNFTRKIIQQCAFTETGEREFEKVFDIDCGVGLKGSGFIVGGNETKRGQWPFMAALIFEPSNQLFCGGNVITSSHVLTAVHCIQNKHEQKSYEARDIVILLGRHNISLRAEVGSEIRGVKEATIHPHWNPHDIKFEGDIAVLGMDRAVQFSELIQPVCLTVEPEISQREAGYVVGWGKSESGARHENIPRQVLISSVTTDVCFSRDFKLGRIFSQGMFCAGGDGAGPCTGDSGGGYFVRYHGLWTLRGVVSSGSSKADGGCDVGRYSLYTNVWDYTEWIKNVIKGNATKFTRPTVMVADKNFTY